MVKIFEAYGFTVKCRDYISSRESDMLARTQTKLFKAIKSDDLANMDGMDNSKLMELCSQNPELIFDLQVVQYKIMETLIQDITHEITGQFDKKNLGELPAKLICRIREYINECVQDVKSDIQSDELEDFEKKKMMPPANGLEGLNELRI